MKPYYDHAGITIYHGDCREILPTLGKVDAVITDPPYGLGFKDAGWDREIVTDWLPLAIGATSGPVMFTTAPTTMWDYPRPDSVACWYRPAAQSRAPSGGFNHWTPIMVYGVAKWPVDTKSLHAIANRSDDIAHPSPKPIALILWMISGVPAPCDLILDPFMGSGTTLRAAKDLGRRAIGIEIEERYCEIAAKRLSQEVLFGVTP